MTHSAPNPNENPNKDSLIRVAANSQPTAVAGAIAKQIRTKKSAEAQAIGVNAVNNMLKATIIANSYLHEENLNILMQPSFIEVDVEGRTLTAIHLLIQPCDVTTTGDCAFK